jgi:hypothetical protein
MRPWTARKYLKVSRFARKTDVDLKKALEDGDQERAAQCARFRTAIIDPRQRLGGGTVDFVARGKRYDRLKHAPSSPLQAQKRRLLAVPKWRATVDEDGHYSFAVAL